MMAPIEIASATENTTSESEFSMGLIDHLRELRLRLVYSMIAVAIGTACAFYFSTELFTLLAHPFREAFPGEKLIGTGPAEAFVLKLKAALFAGVVLASPIIFWQGWLFVAPGLYDDEKKLAIPFVLSTTFLFLVGVCFAYTIVIPFAFEFFHAEYESIGIAPTIRISEFLSLIIRIILGFGLVFETPVLAYFLGRIGIITDTFLIKYYRHAIVIIFVVSAVLTPPDVVTQSLMACPLIVLYGISILLVRYTAPKAEALETDE